MTVGYGRVVSHELRLDRCTNLLELLEQRAGQYAQRRAFRFLSPSASEDSLLTFAETAQRARAIAARLQDETRQGDRALLLFPPGPDFVCAFLGCIAAGVVAVPVFPPDPLRLDKTLPRLLSIVRDAQPCVVLTDSILGGLAGPITAAMPELRDVPWVQTGQIDASGAVLWRRPLLHRESLALLQYTSGSTSSPKGVKVGHGNLLANLHQQATWLGDDRDGMRSICWLPFYHDMGLISGILLTICCGGETGFISPVDFVRRPMLWLEAISRYRADFAGGPDFAYALCARRSTPEERARLDLSSWKIAFSGAEPVRARTLAKFASTFACAGFRPEALAPCYGLAEATLLVTIAPKASTPTVVAFEAAHLEDGLAVPANPHSVRRTTLVSSGRPVPGVDVRIVEPGDSRPLPPGRVGAVCVRGPNVAMGYWNSTEATATCFDQELPGGETGFLRTGDLGFLHRGELYLTSRQKDLIIIRGRNHSPADIEHTVERADPAIRPGSCAAFSVDADDGERLVVVAEANEIGDDAHRSAVFEAASSAVFAQHGIAIEELVLIARRTIPRTSSGKIQRHAARAAYMDGTLEALASPAPSSAPSDRTRPRGNGSCSTTRSSVY